PGHGDGGAVGGDIAGLSGASVTSRPMVSVSTARPWGHDRICEVSVGSTPAPRYIASPGRSVTWLSSNAESKSGPAGVWGHHDGLRCRYADSASTRAVTKPAGTASAPPHRTPTVHRSPYPQLPLAGERWRIAHPHRPR